MKAFINNNRMLLFFILLIWIKTTIASSITFQVMLHSFVDVLLYTINPLLFLIAIYSIGLFIHLNHQPKFYLTISLLLTAVLYSNVVYFREFCDIITLPMVLMSANMGDLSTSIFTLIQWYDILFFIDVLLIMIITFKKVTWFTVTQIQIRQSKVVITVMVIFIALSFATVKSLDKTQSFNREQLVQSIGIYNFYVYDALIHTHTSTQTVFSEEDDWSGVKNHLNKYRVPANEEMFGIAEDMNVLVVSLESLESFVIGESLHGEEITPFLNELIEDSFYFENFYYQTGQGKTSDAEFLVNNSLYPLGRGAVFLTHFDNEYQALPKTLKKRGYHTSVFHANDETFYNRNVMYPNLGYDKYYSFSDYEISRENSVGWGLKDIDFVEQSMNYMTELPEPFYSTMITLTNHFPFDLDEEDHLIEPFHSESPVVNQYFPTVRYTDEAMRILVERLKEEGLYENTILVMYGDHYGIANSHYEELSKFLGKEIDMAEEIKLKRVPLIIHIPGLEGKTIDTVSGQVDIMPTLLNLLGISAENHTMFGNDLFAENRDDFAVLRSGVSISDEFIYTNDMCLDDDTGKLVSIEKCKPIKDRGISELYYSDKIIYGDLFRFLN